MKKIYEHEFGEGGKAGAYIENGEVQVKASYPVKQLAEPILAKLDPLKEKLKAVIPGDWENEAVDKIFDGVKAEIIELISN